MLREVKLLTLQHRTAWNDALLGKTPQGNQKFSRKSFLATATMPILRDRFEPGPKRLLNQPPLLFKELQLLVNLGQALALPLNPALETR